MDSQLPNALEYTTLLRRGARDHLKATQTAVHHRVDRVAWVESVGIGESTADNDFIRTPGLEKASA